MTFFAILKAMLTWEKSICVLCRYLVHVYLFCHTFFLGDAVSGALPLNKPKPEIRHLFKEPEVRPPQLVSTAFTGLCLVPIAIMIVGWMKLGVDLSNFPLTPMSIGFHLGLASIFGLYLQFWLHLNMFTTIKYLIMVGIVTFLCGNSLLVKIAEKRKNA